MEATAQRLDRTAKWVTSKRPPSDQETKRLYHGVPGEFTASLQPPDEEEGGDVECDPKLIRTHRQAELLQTRLGGGGNLASAFAPQRHTAMVAGRPVQADGDMQSIPTILYKHFPGYDFLGMCAKSSQL